MKSGKRCGSCVLSFVPGDVFAGIITSDDHSAYSAYHKNGLRQLCWAHLIRKFKALEDVRGSPDACRFAKCMLKEIEKLFTCWYAFLDKALTREELRQSSALIRGRMKRLCRHYQSSSDNAVVTRASQTLKNWNHLFTFIFHEGVEPTNNAAERALRFAVHGAPAVAAVVPLPAGAALHGSGLNQVPKMIDTQH
ncbi:MAG: transposase [Syntrophobacteraceae bacterium]